MIGFITRRKRMKGGLYFGPAGWSPAEIEGFAEPENGDTPPPKQLPEDRGELLQLLDNIQLGRTSAMLPSLAEQLQELSGRRMRALVLNLLPTQPEYALASALSEVAIADILAGLDAVQRHVRAKRVMIAMDRHDYRLRRLWRRANRSRRYTLVPLVNRYPQAHPTLLVWSLFAKRLPVGRAPVRANRMIIDPVTCWALGRYLRSGEAFKRRPVQVYAPTRERPEPRITLVEIGEAATMLCERMRIPLLHRQVIVNGLLAGEEVDPVHFRIQPDTDAITVREVPALETASPCFACGWCVDVCPTALNPVNLLDLAEHAQQAAGGTESAAIAGLLRSHEARESLHCVGCGLCSYVCPTRLPLTQQTLRLRTWVADAGNRHEGVRRSHV
ncbi:MAG: 4Fe-4S dicluster domain-containing protein [Phycisphaerae bacterium]